MEIVDFGRLRRAQRAELEGDEDDPFDAAGSTLAYQPKEHHVAIKDARGRLVASTGMLVVDVEVVGARFRVSGLRVWMTAIAQLLSALEQCWEPRLVDRRAEAGWAAGNGGWGSARVAIVG